MADPSAESELAVSPRDRASSETGRGTAPRAGGFRGHPEAATALRASGFRVTVQRLAVHDALRELDRHVSVEEVMGAVSSRLPSVSLPTVYSALEALEEAGLVRRVAAGRGAALYDARRAEHQHLVCRRCGAVEDLDLEIDLEPALSRAGRQGFWPEAAEVVVHGLCARCRG